MPVARSLVVAASLALSLVAAAGCGSKRGADPELGRRIEACAAALDATEALPPGERATALARGCPYACPGLPAWADAIDEALVPGASGDLADIDALLRPCNLACSPQAADEIAAALPRDRLRALVAACGSERFGLGPHEAGLVTADWLVLSTINAWIERARPGIAANQLAQEALERAELRAQFLLPLPEHADGRYELPVARHPRPSSAALYLVVTETEVRAAAVPRVRLHGRLLERRTMPGGELPGQLLSAGNLGTSYAELDEMLATQSKPALGAIDRAPLVLADGALLASRLFDVLSELGEPVARLGVRGFGAQGHRVALERASSETDAAPILAVRDADFALIGFGDDRVASGATLADELRHFAAVHAPVRKLILQPHPRLTVAELATLLDAAADAKVAALVFRPTQSAADAAVP